MHRNGLRLLRNINALLDLARLDAGELRLRAGPLGLNQLRRDRGAKLPPHRQPQGPGA